MIVTPTFGGLPAPILAHAKNQGHGNTSTDERITDVACRDHGCLIQVNILSVESANETHWAAWPDGGGWCGGGAFGLFRFAWGSTLSWVRSGRHVSQENQIPPSIAMRFMAVEIRLTLVGGVFVVKIKVTYNCIYQCSGMSDAIYRFVLDLLCCMTLPW